MRCTVIFSPIHAGSTIRKRFASPYWPSGGRPAAVRRGLEADRRAEPRPYSVLENVFFDSSPRARRAAK